MSQVENPGNTAAGAEGNNSSDKFALQVVSPSVGVTGPLSFPDLPSGTTVKQLKEKIRQSLPMQPSDNHQRLIHRGRLLARNDETMAEIFGRETLKVPELQTLHLVLKPSDSDSTPSQNVTSTNSQRGPPLPRPFSLPPPPPLPEILRQRTEAVRQRLSNIPTDGGLAREIRISTPPRFPTPPLPHTGRSPNEQIGSNQQVPLHNNDAQLAGTMRTLQQEVSRLHLELLNRHNAIAGSPGRLPTQNQLQTPNPIASFQHLVAQQQRDRAALGMHGAQQHGGQQEGNTATNSGNPGLPHIQVNRIMHAPQQTRMSSQEVTGPNGDRWTVTVNETTTIYPSAAGSSVQPRTTTEASSLRDAEDVIQNIARAINTNAQQSRTTQNNGASIADPALSASIDVIATQPTSTTSQETTNPAPLPISNVHASSEQHPVSATNVTSVVPTLDGPTVYILSSPTGPRGLLVSPSENGLEAFYTPRRQVQWDNSRRAQQAPNNIQGQNNGAQGPPEIQNRRHVRYGQIFRHAHQHHAGPARAAPVIAHPANPPARPGAAQVWPQIWLIARLLVFIWFFTSGNSSWWRLIMISVVAFFIFLGSTGVLDRIIEQFWGPVRRHLENLLPLAGPDMPQAARANQVAAPPVVGVAAPAQGEAVRVADAVQSSAAALPPDPNQTAVRLLEQRRAANNNWIWTQFRRLEHATILFIASLVPGVGERHIAARVAEENIYLEAERLRRAADTAIPDEEARASEGEPANGGNVPPGSTDTDTTGVDTPTTDVEEGASNVQSQNENPTGSRNTGAEDAPTQPLVDV